MSGTKGVTGYRTLTSEEVTLINEIKAAEAFVAGTWRKVFAHSLAQGNESRRQAAIARTQLEQGFMSMVRAVALPVSPWEAGDE